MHQGSPVTLRLGFAPMPPRKARPRRTREESDRARSLATRERLLQATCDALVARGYAGATTVEICRRARLGRGTMLHHYPERQALMVAAVQHVFEQRLASLEEREAELGGDRIDVGALLDRLFDPAESDRTTLAWLELLVASRTDRALHRALTRMMAEFDQRVADAVRRWLGAPDESSELAFRFALALQNGLVLDRIAGYQHGPQVAAAFRALAVGSLAGSNRAGGAS